MKRRDFLQGARAVAIWPLRWVPCFSDDQRQPSKVMTVTGEITADQLGKMLPHEQILVDFIGADQVSRERYDADEVFNIMLPYVKQVKALGCETFVDCTPAYLGRDPKLLQRISQATAVKFLTNTGYYGALEGKFLPEHAFKESADTLAKRWIAEWKDGIEDTGIRPGFIKIGVDAGPLTDINRKLVQAAARCHWETGLTFAAHTGDGKAALEQVEVLRKEGVSPSAWIWVHAQNERETQIHLDVARTGAWVEFDGIGPDTIDRHVELVKSMRAAGLLEHILLSHDTGWYSVGEPRGGRIRGFDTLYREFVPGLTKAGLNAAEINQLIVANPAKAFAIGIRAA